MAYNNNLIQTPDDQGIAGGLGTLPKKPKLQAPAAPPPVLPTTNPGGIGQLSPDAGQPLGSGEKLMNNLRQNGSEFANANLANYLQQKRAADAYAAAHPAPGAAPAPPAPNPQPTLSLSGGVNGANPFNAPDPAYNLATAGAGATPVRGAAVAAPAPAAIDSGVTLPGGRKLAYGAMVNGVPTFSDGSGGMGGKPGSIPVTMNKTDIASLGNRLNIVPATAFTQPGAGVVADAAGAGPR